MPEGRDAGAAGPTPSDGGAGDAAGAVFAAGRDLAHDASDLAALEARLAVAAGSRILVLVGVMAVTAAAAWLLLQAAAGLALVDYYGASPATVLAGLALLNGVALLVMRGFVMRLTRHMTFAATRRFLLTGGVHATSHPPD